jgi:hypothetical protein
MIADGRSRSRTTTTPAAASGLTARPGPCEELFGVRLRGAVTAGDTEWTRCPWEARREGALRVIEAAGKISDGGPPDAGRAGWR